MKKFRVVQVGTGPMVHSEHAMRTMRRRNDLFDVLGLVEENDSRYLEIKDHPTYRGLRRLTWEEAVALRPEGVLIEADEHELVGNAIRSLEAGFPTYMDKPGSEESANFHRMCHIAETKKLPLVLGYMYRTNPAILYALEMKRSGKFGRIFSVEAQMNNCCDAGYLKNAVARFKGGMMYYLGCHLIDFVVSAMGRPEKVTPFLRSAPGYPDHFKTNCMAVLEYPHAFVTLRSCSKHGAGSPPRLMRIIGTHGSIVFSPLERFDGKPVEIELALEKDTASFPQGSHTLHFVPQKNRYEVQLLELADVIRGKCKPTYSYEHDYLVHEVTLAASGYTKWS